MAAAPKFTSTIAPLSEALKASMRGHTWRTECPVPLDALRLVAVSHFTPHGDVAEGQLVVHQRVAVQVRDIFSDLFVAKFPIARMEPIEKFGGDDEKSMQANNTSAFNCRAVTGGKGFSKHAYGVAIDINPLWNPYVRERGEIVVVKPSTATDFVARTPSRPGMISRGDAVHRAFTTRGGRGCSTRS